MALPYPISTDEEEAPATDAVQREQAHVRSYTLLQELEQAFEGTSAARPTPTVGLTWLLSSQNENGLFIDSYRDLFPVLGRQVEAAMRGHILRDQSYAVTLHQRTNGKTRRYSSFGHARLAFPRRRLLRSALNAALHRALDAFPSLDLRPIEADEAYSLTHKFVQEEGWDRLAETLQSSRNGEDLWQPFSPSERVRNEERPGVFLQRLDQYAEQYENQAHSQMQRALGRRKRELVQEQRRAVLQQTYDFLDGDEDDNGAARALAWLAALEGRPSEYIQGDIDSFPITLRGLDKEVKGYFDRHFAPMLFGDGDDGKTLFRRTVASSYVPCALT